VGTPSVRRITPAEFGARGAAATESRGRLARTPGKSRSYGPRLAALALAPALLVTGCALPPEPAPSAAAALPEGVQVELFQLRSDVAERGAQVRVINGSDDDLVVTRLVFDDDWFAGEGVRDRTSTIAAGRTVDLRIALPGSECEGEPDAAARTSRVRLEFANGGSATVEVADALGFTTLLHEKECLRHDLAQVATLEWASFTASTAPLPAELRLSVTPSGGSGSAQLNAVQTTNLLMFAEGSAAFPLALSVSASDAPTEVVVPIVPLRCDPHAVMEDKRGTVFNIAVDVDGASGVVEVAASEPMRGVILRWVADWCGFGPG